jgi:predicted porin
MKKSLIALAVLAASGAAMAQSSVTIYGLADVWVGSQKDSTNGVSNGSFGKMASDEGFATSRLGFKGTEDLGGGLKANFQIETNVGFDQPAATSLGNRQAWVGLSGGFGEVQLGRVWTPYDDTRALINDTFNANFASSFNVWEGYFDRTSNGIRYNTPSFGGLSAAVVYAFGEDKTATTKASSLTSFSLNYANGPIAAGLAHQIEKDNNATAPVAPATAVGIYTDASSLSGLLGAQTSKRTYTLINGSYDLGVAKLIAGYNTVKATSGAVAGNAKANEWNIGAEVPLGSALALGVGYAESQVKLNGVDQNDTTGYSAALKYTLSKRTFFYGGLTKAEEETAAGAPVSKTTRVFAGVSHAF